LDSKAYAHITSAWYICSIRCTKYSLPSFGKGFLESGTATWHFFLQKLWCTCTAAFTCPYFSQRGTRVLIGAEIVEHCNRIGATWLKNDLRR